MKKIKIILLLTCLGFNVNSFAAFPIQKATQATTQNVTIENATQISTNTNKVAVKMLTKKETKAAVKKLMKADGAGIDKTLYIVLAIIGLGFVGMGINDNWKGSDWVISLILSCLFLLPGVIYSLVKMKKYYK